MFEVGVLITYIKMKIVTVRNEVVIAYREIGVSISIMCYLQRGDGGRIC